MKRSNKHKLRASLIILTLLCFTVVGSVVAQSVSRTESPKNPTQITLSTTAIINDINAERASAGLPPVSETPQLDSSAALKSKELSKVGWNPNIEANHLNALGQQTYTYVFNVAPACRTAAENLSFSNPTSQAVVDAWKNSPAHLAAMNGNYQMAGVGITDTYVTLHLCQL